MILPLCDPPFPPTPFSIEKFSLLFMFERLCQRLDEAHHNNRLVNANIFAYHCRSGLSSPSCFFRLKSSKPFGSRESIKGASQWGSSEPLDQATSTTLAMGAMNGNPSMRSSTGAGKNPFFPCFFLANLFI